MILAGIDYGSKEAGTTALSLLRGKEIEIFQSEKKQNADEFLLELLAQHKPDLIGIDAPLSLPGRYRNYKGYDDFFYRKGDRELSAMSPMFLGGLTARAMKLKAELEKQDLECIEIYPAALAKELELDDYKGKAAEELESVQEQVLTFIGSGMSCKKALNWHQLDSLLALFSTLRAFCGTGRKYGTKREGQIFV